MTLLGLWARPRRPWLSDPYGTGNDYWQTCLDIIDNAIENIAAQPISRACRSSFSVANLPAWADHVPSSAEKPRSSAEKPRLAISRYGI
jgi:hypothetical protein